MLLQFVIINIGLLLTWAAPATASQLPVLSPVVRATYSNVEVWMLTGDPSRNNELLMLTRQDVTAALRLNNKQCACIEAGIDREDDRLYDEYMKIDTGLDGLLGWSSTRHFSGALTREAAKATATENTSGYRRARPLLMKAEHAQVGAAVAAMHAALSPSQGSRLVGIDLQFRGPLALRDDAVASLFRLSPDQARQVSNIWAKYKAARTALMQESRNDSKSSHDPSAAVYRIGEAKYRKDLGNEVLGLLTSQQQARWHKLIGEPFRFDSKVEARLPNPREHGKHEVLRQPAKWWW